MQLSRLFEIVYILLHRRRVTARELAERFEVSVRTIYRDIEALSAAGVPVYATQGVGGGIHINDSYVLNKSTLTDEEQAEILLALQSLSATGHIRADGLAARLGNFFDKESSDWIEVDFSRWGAPTDLQTFTLLKDAILRRHTLRFTYYSSYGERSARHVCPVKLTYKGRAWYLQAFDLIKDAYRTFKLLRMKDVETMAEPFAREALPPPPSIDPPAAPPAFEPPVIVLRFSSHAAWRVWDEFDPECAEINGDGTLTVRARYYIDDWLVTYLLSFGMAVEVQKPRELRQALVGELRKNLKRYEEEMAET